MEVIKTPTMKIRLNLMNKTVRLKKNGDVHSDNSEANDKNVQEIIDDNHNNETDKKFQMEEIIDSNDENENNMKNDIDKSS